jgi:hypothetical protein
MAHQQETPHRLLALVSIFTRMAETQAPGGTAAITKPDLLAARVCEEEIMPLVVTEVTDLARVLPMEI